MAIPIGSTYIQFAEDNGTFDASKSPEKLFGGTWQLKYNTESVFFRTEGSLSEEGRSNGIQNYAIKNIVGSVPRGTDRGVFGPKSNIVDKTTLLGISGSYDTTWVTGGGSGNKVYYLDFDASRVVNTSNNETRVKNRKIRIYKRIA